MRQVRMLLYFVVGLLLGANVVLGYAETIDATASQTSVSPTTYSNPSALSVCQNRFLNSSSQYNRTNYLRAQIVAASAAGLTPPSDPATTYYCYLDNYDNNFGWIQGYSVCPSGTTYSGGQCVGTGYTCPSSGGWTLSGSTCTRPDCAAGQVRDSSGQCVIDCQSKAGQGVPISWCMVANVGATSCTGDSGGCLVRCASVKFSVNPGLSLWPRQAMGENCKFTGIQSAASDGSAIPLTDEQLNDLKQKVAPAPTPSGCAGVGRDYVTLSSGVTTCLDGDPNANVVQSQSKKTSTAGSGSGVGDGGGGADPLIIGDKETDTSCQGDECKTTTKTTTDPDPAKNGTDNGGCAAGATLQDGKCVSTTTQTQNAGDYCAAHPNDTVCKGFKDACESDPDRAGCKAWGTPGDDGSELATLNLGVSSLTPVALASNNSCPSPVNLPMGQVFSYEAICNWAAQWRPLVLAVAALGALLIIVGVKNG